MIGPVRGAARLATVRKKRNDPLLIKCYHPLGEKINNRKESSRPERSRLMMTPRGDSPHLPPLRQLERCTPVLDNNRLATSGPSETAKTCRSLARLICLTRKARHDHAPHRGGSLSPSTRPQILAFPNTKNKAQHRTQNPTSIMTIIIIIIISSSSSSSSSSSKFSANRSRLEGRQVPQLRSGIPARPPLADKKEEENRRQSKP